MAVPRSHSPKTLQGRSHAWGSHASAALGRTARDLAFANAAVLVAAPAWERFRVCRDQREFFPAPLVKPAGLVELWPARCGQEAVLQAASARSACKANCKHEQKVI